MKVIEGSLEAYGQAELSKIKIIFFSENLESGAEFPYLGITVPKYENRSNFSLDEDREVVEGSLEAYGKANWAR